jgi:hypothetical protein
MRRFVGSQRRIVAGLVSVAVASAGLIALAVPSNAAVPVVSITSPKAGAKVSGDVVVVAKVADGKAVKRVVFSANGTVAKAGKSCFWTMIYVPGVNRFCWNSESVTTPTAVLTAKVVTGKPVIVKPVPPTFVVRPAV